MLTTPGVPSIWGQFGLHWKCEGVGEGRYYHSVSVFHSWYRAHPGLRQLQAMIIVSPPPMWWHYQNTLKFLILQNLDNVLSATSSFLIGNGKCKQLSDWSELELSTVSDFCTLWVLPLGPMWLLGRDFVIWICLGFHNVTTQAFLSITW